VGVREQLVALAKVGRIDASTQELDKELKDIPNEVNELRQSVALLEGLLAKERSQLEAAQNLRDQQDSLIKEANDAIGRAKGKTAKAKNQREAEAVERELEATRRSLKERETERESLTGAIDQVQKSLTQHEAEFGQLRDALTQKDGEAQVRISELEAKRKIALHGRDDLAALVPRDVLRRYDAIRGRRGTAVVEVRDGVCQGCRMSVRPMQYIVIQREEGIEQCAQCQRYLYLASWMSDDKATLEAGEAGPIEPKDED
jgi:predicted  nucleic acid-binding Zn-ribbon protein